VRACALVRAVAGPAGTAFEVLRAEAPVGLFPGSGAAPGWAQLWLVGTAAGPLGGDDVEVQVQVGAGAALAVGSVAASIALSGAAPSVMRVRVVVEPGGWLTWAPEPLIVTAGADHRVDVAIDAAAGAHVWWREELVLGRHGETAGRCVVALRAARDGVPWLRHELGIGVPGWDGGAVLGVYRTVGSVLATGRGAIEDAPVVAPAAPEGGTIEDAPVVAPEQDGRVADLRLEAGGTLTVALARDRPTLLGLLPPVPVARRSHAPVAYV